MSADAPAPIAEELEAQLETFDDGDSLLLRIQGSLVGMVPAAEVETAVAHVASLVQDYVADNFATAWPELIGTGVLDIQLTGGVATWSRGEITVPVGQLAEWARSHRFLINEPWA